MRLLWLHCGSARLHHGSVTSLKLALGLLWLYCGSAWLHCGSVTSLYCCSAWSTFSSPCWWSTRPAWSNWSLSSRRPCSAWPLFSSLPCWSAWSLSLRCGSPWLVTSCSAWSVCFSTWSRLSTLHCGSALPAWSGFSAWSLSSWLAFSCSAWPPLTSWFSTWSRLSTLQLYILGMVSQLGHLGWLFLPLVQLGFHSLPGFGKGTHPSVIASFSFSSQGSTSS